MTLHSAHYSVIMSLRCSLSVVFSKFVSMIAKQKMKKVNIKIKLNKLVVAVLQLILSKKNQKPGSAAEFDASTPQDSSSAGADDMDCKSVWVWKNTNL